MLGITRTDIEKYARERQLSWCEDPTNAEVDADRNYIRHNIMPVIDSRFPGAKKALLAGLGRDLIARGQLNERLSGQLEQVRHSLDGLKLDLLRLMPTGRACVASDPVAGRSEPAAAQWEDAA